MVRRFALMVAAGALSAGSVAPAQVVPVAAPEQAATIISADEPLVVTPVTSDPLQPAQVAGSEEPAPAQPAEQEPRIVRGASLSETVSRLRSSDPGSRELECLAAGVYFESKGEPLAGQLAVGQVIANRANSRGRFPGTYCGVLTQRGQFSFVRSGRWPAMNRNSLSWRTAVAIARIVDGDLHDSTAAKALFFHARRLSPGWRKTKVALIGNHVFYR